MIGIGNRGTLIDGGTIFVPESAFASAKGEWIIEGHGVDPDIEVENDPKSEIEGRDPQLERAVAEVMKKLKDHPVKLPPRPARACASLTTSANAVATAHTASSERKRRLSMILLPWASVQGLVSNLPSVSEDAA